MEACQPEWNDYLSRFDFTPAAFQYIPLETTKHCVIVEPRKLLILPLVIKNFMFMLQHKGWGLIVFHGTDNEDFIREHLSGWPNVQYVNIGVSDLTSEAYSNLLCSPWFWKRCLTIGCRRALIFQCDTILLKDTVDNFEMYDYVGAPWCVKWLGCLEVGNGGLSLRNVQTMLDITCKKPRAGMINEDIYFSYYCLQDPDIHVPTFDLARSFAVETVYHENPCGMHQPHISRFPSRQHYVDLLMRPVESQSVYKKATSDLCLASLTCSPQNMLSPIEIAAIHIQQQYDKAASFYSDIHEHVPTLMKYARKCDAVVEFGVRSGVSSWGFIKGLLENVKDGRFAKLDGVDLSPCPFPYSYLESVKIPCLVSSFLQANDLEVPPVVCDLLFIDTFHVYGQLKRELERHAAGVKKYIIMHDTTVDEYEGELRRCEWNASELSSRTGIPAGELLVGLWPAVEWFLAGHPEWRLKRRFTNNNGLTVLKRQRTDDEPIPRMPTTHHAYPISFSIPACKVLAKAPSKSKLFGHVVPGETRTYIFSDEAAYYSDYQASVFGITCKKRGWDCMRHYEILANGTIPYFTDLQHCPPLTMTHLPKTMILEGMKLFENVLPDDVRIQTFVESLLEYTRTRLTTKAMAMWALQTAGFSCAKSVLFLSQDPSPDYLRCTLLHGFKELFHKECHDFPEISHLYSDCTVENHALYGKGFSYSKLLNKERNRDSCRDNSVYEDIRSRRYDVIIYGSVHRGMPMWDLVNENYSKHEILLFCGEDPHECLFSQNFNSYPFFLRENYAYPP